MHVVDGNKVRAKRIQLGLTQMALAVSVESSPSYISTIEKAQSGVEMTVDMAYRLAKALSTQKSKVHIEDFLAEV